MRHLGEQVRRNGPQWLFSAFCFESANHNLLSAVQGTIKEPENIIERFVKHQAATSSAIVESTEKCLKGLTDVDAEVKLFCEKFGVKFFFSRFVSSDGQCFASLSYSRLGDNLGDCLFQLKDGRFFRVTVFFSNSDGNFAVGKSAKVVKELFFDEKMPNCGFFMSCLALEPWKKSVLPTFAISLWFWSKKIFLVLSLMREGFEHN